jgi:hypothetical protein
MVMHGISMWFMICDGPPVCHQLATVRFRWRGESLVQPAAELRVMTAVIDCGLQPSNAGRLMLEENHPTAWSSPSEANSRSASQEIPRLLCKPTVHCRAHKSPPLVHTLRQLTPLHFTSYHCVSLKHILMPYFHGEISGSHGEYEDGCLLRCCAVRIHGSVQEAATLIFLFQ